MKVLDWTETSGIYSNLILASVVPSIVPICKNLATQKSFTGLLIASAGTNDKIWIKFLFLWKNGRFPLLPYIMHVMMYSDHCGC